ncbi:MAG: ankyrin repeat protein [bacterium]|nr:MAG: ankyrin repeat protein [bacterium]
MIKRICKLATTFFMIGLAATVLFFISYSVGKKDGYTWLNDAVARNNILETKMWLSLGVNVETQDISGKTALMEGSRKGYKEIVRLLLDKGADVNNHDSYNGNTALIYAAIYGQTEIAEMLLKKGANVNAKSHEYQTALIVACQPSIYSCEPGNIETLKLLIKNGASINDINALGKTSLMMASNCSNEDIVRVLLNAGADSDIKDRKGQTALMIAIENGKENIVNILKRDY